MSFVPEVFRQRADLGDEPLVFRTHQNPEHSGFAQSIKLGDVAGFDFVEQYEIERLRDRKSDSRRFSEVELPAECTAQGSGSL